MNADLALGEVSVSLLRSFPRASVSITDVVVTNRKPFKGTELANIGEIRVAVDMLSLVSGEPRVREVALIDPVLNVKVKPNGKANYDIALASEEEEEAPAEDEEAAPYSLKLDSFEVQNLKLRYRDKQNKLRLAIDDLDHQTSGDFSDKLVDLKTHTDIAAMTFKQGRVKLLKDSAWNVDFDVQYDQESGKITFGDNKVGVNALTLEFQGSVEPKNEEDWQLDLSFASKDSAFEALLSMVPNAYGKDFKDIKAGGTISLQGKAVGLYDADAEDHLPGLDLAVQINDGSFAYPGMSESIEALAMDLVVKHPEGSLDTLDVNLKSFTVKGAGSDFQADAVVKTPMSDPYAKANAKGTLNLGKLAATVPEATDGNSISGIATMNFALDGKASEFDSGRAKKAQGTFGLKNVKAESEDLPVPMRVDSMAMAFSPSKITLSNTRVGWGKKSNLSMDGEIRDMVGYLLSPEGVLRGHLNMSSSYIDARPFQAETDEPDEPAEAAAADSEAVVVPVPERISFTSAGTFKEVVTQDFTMTNVKYTAKVKDQVARLDDLSANMLGGRVGMSGTYAAKTSAHADVDFQIKAANFDLGETTETFSTVGNIAPILKGTGGRFDGDFNVATRVQKDGTPDLNILLSAGSFMARGIKVAPSFMKDVSKKTSPQASSLSAGGSSMQYAIKNGTMTIQPYLLKVGPFDATLSGTSGIVDEKLDLNLEMPLPAAAAKGLGKALGKNAGDSEVTVTVNIFNTYSKPKVKVKVGGVGSMVSGAVNDLIDKASAAGDLLIAQAEKAAEVLKTEADKKATALVKKASNPLQKKAAQESGKVIRKQAASKGDKLIAEAKKEKEKLVEKAKKESAKRLK